MLSLVALTMGIIFFLPKLPQKLPEALIAILVISFLVIFGNLDVATVGGFIRDGGGTGLEGETPIFQGDLFTKIPLNFESNSFIFPYFDSCDNRFN